MGVLKKYQKEKLFVGIFFFNQGDLNMTLARLEEEWGKSDYVSESIDFTQFSTYYNDEMGTSSLSKIFVSFENLVNPSKLFKIKLWTNSQEENFSMHGKRRVNIDPGLLSLGYVVLATTKNAGHKIALDQGIYADLTLIYEKKAYRVLPWTYPDFRSSSVQDTFLCMRKIYKNQLKFES